MKHTLVLLIALLTTGLLFAQDEETKKDPAVTLNADISAGLIFDESVAAVGQVDIVGWDFMGATSGFGLEVDFDNAQYSFWILNRVNLPKTAGRLYVGADIKFAQSTRHPSKHDHHHHLFDNHVNALTIWRGHPEWDHPDERMGLDWDADFRVVAGVRVHEIGPVDLKIEAYFAEYETPITVAILVSF